MLARGFTLEMAVTHTTNSRSTVTCASDTDVIHLEEGLVERLSRIYRYELVLIDGAPGKI